MISASESATRPPTSLPETVRRCAFDPVADLSAAHELTQQLAHTHYENFSVVSKLLPKHLRQDFCNIYAFCRIADDLGDEAGDRAAALGYLEQFRAGLRACYGGSPNGAVYVALSDTIARHEIPIQPFLDLIDAFEQDQRISRYQTFEQVTDYCRRSANPVGRLVLYVCGYSDDERQRLSDFTCTGLQLANFWQDVRRDLIDLDRIYLPADSLARFGVTEQQLHEGRVDDRYRELIRFEVDRTESLFVQGDALLPMLDPSIRSHVALFGQGGRATLDAIRRQNYDTLSSRPSLSPLQKGRLVLAAVGAQVRHRLGGKTTKASA